MSSHDEDAAFQRFMCKALYGLPAVPEQINGSFAAVLGQPNAALLSYGLAAALQPTTFTVPPQPRGEE